MVLANEKEPLVLLTENEEGQHKRNLEILIKEYGGRVDKVEIGSAYDKVKEGYKDARVRKHVPVFILKEARSALDKKLKP